jgi:hypothetical protein
LSAEVGAHRKIQAGYGDPRRQGVVDAARMAAGDRSDDVGDGRAVQ